MGSIWDHLVTTCWPRWDNWLAAWWPIGELTTTWWQLCDQLVAAWWPLEHWLIVTTLGSVWWPNCDYFVKHTHLSNQKTYCASNHDHFETILPNELSLWVWEGLKLGSIPILFLCFGMHPKIIDVHPNLIPKRGEVQFCQNNLEPRKTMKTDLEPVANFWTKRDRGLVLLAKLAYCVCSITLLFGWRL